MRLFILLGCLLSWVAFGQPTSAPTQDPKLLYAEASELFGKQQFLEAAKKFEAGYQSFKENPTYGPAFLYNAAISYQQHDTLTAPDFEAAKRAYKLFEELLLNYPQIPQSKQDNAKQKIAELLLKWPEIVARGTDCSPNKYPFCPLAPLPPPINEPLNFCVEKKLLCRAAAGVAASLSVSSGIYIYFAKEPRGALISSGK